jgi:L-threonylcarbamoyladenylate synthase
MKTQLIKVTSKNKREVILKATELIKKGEIVAFPTETVYGLGANAFDSNAVMKIFAAKGRPADNPLIVHISNLDQLKEVVEFVPKKAQILIKKYWPGPLTIVMKKSSKIPLSVTAGLDTVAVRMPSNKIALELIKRSNCPIAAPSANSSTKPSPTKAQHVMDDLNGKVPLILDGGKSKVGLESTVIGISEKRAVLFRPGKVTLEELTKLIGKIDLPSKQTGEKNKVPSSPGMKYKHYAPKAELILIESKPNLDFSKKVFELSDEKKIGVISFKKKVGIGKEFYSNNDLEVYAKSLFSKLREFDAQGVELIIVEGVTDSGMGSAIMNRLRKAASKII